MKPDEVAKRAYLTILERSVRTGRRMEEEERISANKEPPVLTL